MDLKGSNGSIALYMVIMHNLAAIAEHQGSDPTPIEISYKTPNDFNWQNVYKAANQRPDPN